MTNLENANNANHELTFDNYHKVVTGGKQTIINANQRAGKEIIATVSTMSPGMISHVGFNAGDNMETMLKHTLDTLLE